MDAADTGARTTLSQSLVCSCGLCFSVMLSPHHIPSRKNGGFFLVSSNVSGNPAVSCLCQSTYTSALGLAVFRFLLHSLVPISHSPFRVLHARSFTPSRFVAYRGTNLQVTLL
jgi:hypothetical protein